MKILGIAGSKRKNGNTATLVKKAMEPFQENDNFETEIICLGDYEYSGCRGCEGCRKTNKCVVDDGMTEIYEKLNAADAIIIGSPTYFYNVTSDVKALIDRCYCMLEFDETDRSSWISSYEKKGLKYANIIAICEQQDIKDMGYTAETMELSFRSLGYRIVDILRVKNLYEKNAARKSEYDLHSAYNSGLKLIKTLELLLK